MKSQTKIKKCIDFINSETLTQKEKAIEMGKSVRWIKLLTATKKINHYKPKAIVLYDKNLLIKKEK